MSENSSSTDDGGASDERLERQEDRLHDPDRATPREARDQSAARPERQATVQQDAEQDIAHLENPPQTEGPRERSNDSV